MKKFSVGEYVLIKEIDRKGKIIDITKDFIFVSIDNGNKIKKYDKEEIVKLYNAWRVTITHYTFLLWDIWYFFV